MRGGGKVVVCEAQLHLSVVLAIAAIAGVLLVSHCGGVVAVSSRDGGTDAPGAGAAERGPETGNDAIAPPGCVRPAGLDPFDGAAPAFGQCTAAKMVLSCQYASTMAFSQCLSDDATQCPGSAKLGAQLGVPFTCLNLCESHEYGLRCGDIPHPSPPPPPQPPPNCRTVGHVAEEDQFECCPCGS